MPEHHSDRLRKLASEWEAEVRHRRADHLAARAMLHAKPELPRSRRPLAVATVMAAVAVGVFGLGAIADGAVPGQVLYPIDRAYESVGQLVGVTSDRGEERLVEALALIERGRGTDAADLVDEALTELGRDPSLAEVRAAVEEVAANPPPTTSVPAPPPTTVSPPVASPPVVSPPAETPPSDQPVLTAAEPQDPVVSLQIATEYLLRTVRDAKRAASDGTAVEGVREATESVLVASAAVKEQASPELTVAQDTTTSTTTTSTTTTSTTTTSTTTTSTTTTSTTTTSTTTTTLVDGQEGTGPGPIILPPIP